MTPLSAFSEPASPSRARGHVKDWGARLRPWLIGLILLLLAVLAGELVFHTLLAPQWQLREVVIQGDHGYDQATFLKAAELAGPISYFSLDEEALRQRLLRLPAVREVAVEKIFPGTLKITALRRQPLGLSLVTHEGRTYTVAFDKEGVVYEIERQVRELNLPLLSGLSFEGLREGMRFPEALKPLLSDLDALKRQQPALYAAISELVIRPDAAEGWTLTLYPVQVPIPVEFGSRLNEASLRQMVVLLDLLKRDRNPAQIAGLDFRAGAVVLRTKEE